jgi:Domain of unknown function (DUF6249)
MGDLEDVVAVIFIFGTPVLIILIVFSFMLLRYTQRQRTLRLALEKGQDISPLLAEEAAMPFHPTKYVLRGLLWGLPGLLIGAGVTWAALRDSPHPYLAVFGWIPAAVGAAYLIFYRMGLAPEGGNEVSPPAAGSVVRSHPESE